MRFGPVPVEAALGAILAHSVTVGTTRLGKGRVLGADDLALVRAAGITTLIVAQLDAADVDENAACQYLAEALVPDPEAAGLRLTAPHAGRVNLIATAPGIVVLDAAAIHGLNRIDPAITLATLAPFARVTAGTMVGTIKIISYAVAGAALARASVAARGGVIRRRPVTCRTADLILTESAGQDPKLTEKGRKVIEARLRALGIALLTARVVPHDETAIAVALAAARSDLLLILTGAATSDLLDTAPQGLRRAGGTVARFGMPVDPGNLLFHGTLGARPVIGLPGCARSPALNGADWVLERLACGLAISDDDIAQMGVGGLLKEIPQRPHPRDRGSD